MLWFYYDPIDTDPVDPAAVQTLEQLVSSDAAVRQAAYTQLQASTPAQHYAIKFLLQQLMRRLLLLPPGESSASPDHAATLAEIGAVYACSVVSAPPFPLVKGAVIISIAVDVDFTQEGTGQRWQMLTKALDQVATRLDPWLTERGQMVQTSLCTQPIPSARQLADAVGVIRQIADYNLKVNDLGSWVFLHDLLTVARGRSQGTVGRNARMPAKPGSTSKDALAPVFDMALMQLQVAVQAHLLAHPQISSYPALAAAVEQQRQQLRQELATSLSAICGAVEDHQDHVWLRDKPVRNPLLDGIGEPCWPQRTPVSVFARTFQRTQPAPAEEANFLSRCLSACLKADNEPGVLALLKIIAQAPNGPDWLDLNSQLDQLRNNLQFTISALEGCLLAFAEEEEEVEFELVMGGNKYQVSIRRTGVAIRLRKLSQYAQQAIDQRSASY
jgi:hypothetical protein